MGEVRTANYSTWQEAFVDVKAHAKSNTKQIAEIKDTLRSIDDKLDKNGEITHMIKTVVVDNGLVASIKKQALDIATIKTDFTNYQIHRMESCPVAHQAKENRNWTVTLIKLAFAAVGVISTVLVILDYAKGLR
jgi:hypothetical protein